MALIGGFAMGSTARKKLPEKEGDERHRFTASLYAIALAVSLAIALIGVLASGYLAANVYHLQIAELIAIASILVVFWMLFNLTTSVLISHGKVVQATVMDFVYSFGFLIVGTILIIIGYGVLGAIIGLAFGIIAGAALGIYYMPDKRKILKIGPSAKDGREIFGFAAPVFASNIAQRGLNSFAVLFLALYVSATVVGNYSIAYQIGSFVVIIVTAFTFILLPAFSEMLLKDHTRAKNAMNKSLHLSVIFLAPLVAFVAAESKPIIQLLFSHTYTYAPLYTSMIIVGSAIGILWNFANTLILGSGDRGRFIKYQIIAILVELCAILLLTPIYKAIGIIAGLFVLAQIVIDIVYIYAVKEKFGFTIQVAKPLKVAIAATAMFLILFAERGIITGSYAILIGGIETLAFYPVLIAFAGGITKDEVAFIEKAFGGARNAPVIKQLIDYVGMFAM
jgi:O-antigen/teichoic acid export membrane protein